MCSSDLSGDKFLITLDTQSNSPTSTKFMAVSKTAPNNSFPFNFSVGSYTAGSSSVVSLTTPHNIPTDTTFDITISGSPSGVIDGTFSAISTSSNTFKIEKAVAVAGVGGTVTFINGFVIETTAVATATNLSAAINLALSPNIKSLQAVDVYNALTSTVVITYKDITADFSSDPATSTDSLSIESLIGFKIDSSYEELFTEGDLVDFLQTKPGHRTYAYDITVKATGSRNENSEIIHYFKVTKTDLYTYYSNGYNFEPAIAKILVGDYVCLANECIIPQIPPDLHNALAERTAARILAAIGDTEGLGVANAKLQEIEARQGTLLDGRVEGAPQKITARHSLLRYGKMGTRKRM